jgi:acetyl esterase
MPLHPQAQTMCDAVNALPATPYSDATLAEQRAAFAMLLQFAGEPPPVFSVDDVDADGVPVRIYCPTNELDLPIVYFVHGGGWTIGSVEHYDTIARQIASASGAIVVAPDYRLAPEHPFPAALDDCWRTLCWTARHAPSIGGDAARIAVMGDSAGGNLAAVCALHARDAGAPRLALQVLVYPVTDCDMTTPSYRENGDGYLLTETQMRWFFSCYTRGDVDPTDWRICPLRARDLSGVAPAFVVTAEFDPLRDEGERYAVRLGEAGVPVQKYRYDGMVHAFFGLSAVFDHGRDAIERTARALRHAFGTLGA